MLSKELLPRRVEVRSATTPESPEHTDSDARDRSVVKELVRKRITSAGKRQKQESTVSFCTVSATMSRFGLAVKPVLNWANVSSRT